MTLPERMSLPGPLMLVDDSDDDLALIQMLLRKAGADGPVIPLNNGDAAVEELQRRVASRDGQIAGFFLDVKMPGLTGLELLEWIRQRSAFDRVPVVMCSTSEDPRDVTNAGQSGAQCYITKFPTTAAMREILHAMQEHHRGNRSLGDFDIACNLLRNGAKTRRTGDVVGSGET